MGATIVGLSGCSDETEPGEGQEQSASGSPVDDPSEPADAASSPTSGVDRSSAEKAVAGWVAALIKGEIEQECLLMAEPADGSTPARVGSEKTCGDDAPERKRMEATLGQFKESFTPDRPRTTRRWRSRRPPEPVARSRFPQPRSTSTARPSTRSSGLTPPG
ncbi:conserved hypothetical protein [Streptomyces sviceus ATCC 29083]|uniref:Lipoprotein n=1 Tax=Streptomyces sviceus (strain ATCC 29083 / DSM 924 / JCM 4929 / NBRC 13980 / NCIMB 11184 / NRRL 5439 / UC 5370) TaxID=463191 RepID=B5HPR9_STRX2|nr:conserved hypothetical protein [Streptomyces sviceus ATCC 29083]